MKNKKEFTLKSYSAKVCPLCIAGILLVILADFIRFLVPDKILTISYVAIYAAVCIVALAIFTARNKYDFKKHKNFAILSFIFAVVVLSMRIFAPGIFTGYANTFYGNAIDHETIIAIAMIAIIGMPMFDLIQILKYVQPAQTHTHDDNITDSDD